MFENRSKPSDAVPVSKALIELIGVRRVFEHRASPVHALNGVSLRIHAGEFVCLTGPSGSGKSTLLNIIGCLDRPTEGLCRVVNTDAAMLDDDGLAAFRRDAVGFVFQSYNLLESFTALDNVELPARYAGRPRRECRRLAHESMATLGVGYCGLRRPAELSGGEQQRVAVARALINGAPVILADEPTGALDAAHAGELLDELEALADQGHAVIVASHDGTVAARAHRVVELSDGVVVRDSGSESLRQEAAEDVLRRHRGAMPWLTVVRSGLAALGASRLRALLTVSSVALGTWSILALLSLVEGVGRDIAAAMERMGTNRLTVTPPMRAGGQLQRSPLTMDDAEALNDGVGNITAVIPSMWERLPVGRSGELMDAVIVRAKSESVPRTTQNVRWPLEQGTYLTQRELDEAAQVAVIGPTVRKRLFASGEDPLGTHVHINGLGFVVKGVFTDHPRQEGEGEMMWSSPAAYEWRGRVIHIPFRSGADVLFGRHSLNGLDVLVTDVARIDETAASIKDALYRRHGIDFDVQNNALLWISGKKLSGVHIVVFSTIGAAAIVVGGLGIMAVSLASVSQRAREIGIRRAVGARRRDITAQFLVETAVTTSIGGALGVLLGSAGSPLLSQLTGAPVAFAHWFAPVALTCAFGAGFVFGIVPAHRAARLDPVAALAPRGYGIVIGG